MNIKEGKFLETILAEKKQEIAQMPDENPGTIRQTYRLYDYLKKHSDQLQVIAEVKKASPSLGDINLEVDIIAQAKNYERAGAAMISVLTDPVFFKGNIEYLREISKNVQIPTLNKDFIIDKKQINRAVNAGATVILLIVACFENDFDKLEELYNYAISLGLEVLVETHNKAELDRAHQLAAKIIGVNNRNLKTFEVSLQNSTDLVPYFKEENVYISESGIFGKKEAQEVAENFNGILVGTALMQANNLTKSLTDLKIKRKNDEH
ncbi:indole-3-glycerol phosphate synthase TrpC [Lactococcus cremoris]|uniref:indole-3-glycerol phosphate synthase TrpC n=1 Tax=Lactococcus lactis subsp. cremoris TaxID=1359 RepID=UPI0003AB8DD8|nr:indole-3-glycerol phosphate synthase TrpC [Lactococcus cremoris]AGV73363.1 indole-3-glycerol-phosphate synthase [Lactococcus cremoris subsp. cremoris KW2]